MEKYDVLNGGYIGYGSFGEVWRVENKDTQEVFAIKWFERGSKIDENVDREIMIHKSLCHPSIIQFKEVVLSLDGLGIVMEYAEGGDLHHEIFKKSSRFGGSTRRKKGLGENKARDYFQQLIPGVSYCHSKDVCHRDLKPANILLDGSNPPRLKICDFGYAKSYQLHSKPNSAVGTPLYMAPEVVSREYNGKIADVWSCGMILYAMLVGTIPNPTETSNAKKLMSPECKDLLNRMLVQNPKERITIEEIMEHPWYKMNLQENLAEATLVMEVNPSFSFQSDEEIRKIVEEAKIYPLEEEEDEN